MSRSLVAWARSQRRRTLGEHTHWVAWESTTLVQLSVASLTRVRADVSGIRILPSTSHGAKLARCAVRDLSLSATATAVLTSAVGRELWQLRRILDRTGRARSSAWFRRTWESRSGRSKGVTNAMQKPAAHSSRSTWTACGLLPRSGPSNSPATARSDSRSDAGPSTRRRRSRDGLRGRHRGRDCSDGQLRVRFVSSCRVSVLA